MSAYPEWMSEGICSSVDPELFFPPDGGTYRPAKQICAKCPVRTECASWAIPREGLAGVWGGLGEKERKQLRAIRRKVA